jgi:5-methyltetrahydropteroyltriglutamate--homocysteine methyltransferase
MTSAPRIKTTVVGSYPVPDWLLALPSEQALIDATRVVIHTQEQAGIDLVCDGEFSRFDVNHPETNGMIEYFVRPMAGMRTAITFDELVAYREQRGMGFRTRPPAVVEGAVGAGTLDLPHACARGRRLTARPFKFTLTGPHMLAKSVIDKHYRSVPDLAMAIGDALAEQVRHLDADVVQVDEANLPGSPDEWQWAAAAINRVLDAVKTTPAVHLCFGNYGGQSIQKGSWDNLINYLNALHVDHVVMETAHRPPEELAAFPQVAAGDRPRPGRDRRQVDRDRVRRSDRAQHRTRRDSDGTGPHPLCPPGLRVLDAQAQYRRRKDSGVGRGAQPL